MTQSADSRLAIVVTSIAGPTPAVRQIAAGSVERSIRFHVIGDASSPKEFHLPGCEFHSLRRQRDSGFLTALKCPTGHYARKNAGYLAAIREGAQVIVETDDDNYPREAFWNPRPRLVDAPVVRSGGWVNVYRYFSDLNIWPRGLPLTATQTPVPEYGSLSSQVVHCPIQQGLADENPDVDAIYRLTLPLPVSFRSDRRVSLGTGVWCPFNSQNTAWFQEAFLLMYLPAYCSMRMTDIWRGLIAQRIAWTNGWSVLFHGPTVSQERNDHDLMRDFQDEIAGYLHNARIARELERLTLEPGLAAMAANLRMCYDALVRLSILDARELGLLDAWLSDNAVLSQSASGASA
jgi:hypothetical protein